MGEVAAAGVGRLPGSLGLLTIENNEAISGGDCTGLDALQLQLLPRVVPVGVEARRLDDLPIGQEQRDGDEAPEAQAHQLSDCGGEICHDYFY